MNNTRIISTVTGGLTVCLAGAAFTLSFNSLTELAGQQGLSVPVLFPLILEGGLITFSLTALDRSLNGQDNRLQWAMVVGSSLTAMSFNILHAPDGWLAKTMWAIPSIFLLLSFESFLTQLRYRVSRGAIAADNAPQTDGQNGQTYPAIAEPLPLPAEPLTALAEPATALALANQTRQDNVTARRDRVLTALNAGLTIGQIAGQEGVSIGTIKNDKRSLNGQVAK